MKKPVLFLFVLSFLFLVHHSYAQGLENSEKTLEVSKLFLDQQILPLKLSYSIKEIRKRTNDSTFMDSDLSYKLEDGSWGTLAVKIRTRGNNRLKKCYFPPIKIKIKKSIAEGTLFEGNKKLKLVLPCLLQKDKNDNVVKEYMAYKLYELISPYHYKTRMVSIDFTEIKGNKTKPRKLKGFLIEDISKTADRHNLNVLDNFIHPLNQDAVCSVQNDFFQYMIGNTDFSIAYRHNEKLLFVDKKVIPVPYDFDMSGFVDASYSVVSVVQNEKLNISDVKQRLFRGFKRDESIFRQVRQEFLDNKVQIIEIVNSFESSFDDPKEFTRAKNYIAGFFEVMMNDKKFNRNILSVARTK